jgi:hypothetical protein
LPYQKRKRGNSMKSIPVGFVGVKELVELLIAHLYGPSELENLENIEFVERTHTSNKDVSEKFQDIIAEQGGKKVLYMDVAKRAEQCRERIQLAMKLRELDGLVQPDPASLPQRIGVDYWGDDGCGWRAMLTGEYDSPEDRDNILSEHTIYVEEESAISWVSRASINKLSSGESEIAIENPPSKYLSVRMIFPEGYLGLGELQTRVGAKLHGQSTVNPIDVYLEDGTDNFELRQNGNVFDLEESGPMRDAAIEYLFKALGEAIIFANVKLSDGDTMTLQPSYWQTPGAQRDVISGVFVGSPFQNIFGCAAYVDRVEASAWLASISPIDRPAKAKKKPSNKPGPKRKGSEEIQEYLKSVDDKNSSFLRERNLNLSLIIEDLLRLKKSNPAKWAAIPAKATLYKRLRDEIKMFLDKKKTRGF